ncbi:DUF6255 family natural product biosynthesis protein [Streptomyces cinnamoneus]|uniref:DUF6255 family natural product biosynthesis protein n=1 Tax=Streptomyces cinnamoneus TaxID=53446 RepID=UPI003789C717
MTRGRAGDCPHRGGWAGGGGELRCGECGTRHFTEYGALRPPGLPQAVVPAAWQRIRPRRAVGFASVGQ